MAHRGIEQIFYFQVDNPLARVLDPLFIGHHELAVAQMSTKVVAKTDPHEKVGLVGKVDGRTAVIEYSDLDAELANSRDPDGKLTFRAGNIAIHMLTREFVEDHASGGLELPVHRADKRVAHVDDGGSVVEPTRPNAIKLEMFVFDALPLAERTTTQEVLREDEFAPVKNKSGTDSPQTAADALSAQARRWLAAAGLSAPPVAEVGPLFALDAEEFGRNLTASDFGPVYDRC
jgi:UDP-N-acetylglucosamine/UDP-N-acetylgalactosamine diphosphorylase